MNTRKKTKIAGNTAASALTVLLAIAVAWIFGSGVVDPYSTNYRSLPWQAPSGEDRISQFVGDAAANASKIRAVENPKTDYALSDPGVIMSGKKVPARWCAGLIPYSIDFTGLKSVTSKKTVRQEKQRWSKAFSAWERASEGRYRFTFAGAKQHTIITGEGGLSHVQGVETGEIAVTYGAVGHPLPGYADPHLSGALAHAGFAKPQWPNNPEKRNPEAFGHIRGAAITVDANDLPASNSTRATRVHVHEIGHALGLGHVNNPKSVMHVKNKGPRLPQPGDIRGIERLLSVGCR